MAPLPTGPIPRQTTPADPPVEVAAEPVDDRPARWTIRDTWTGRPRDYPSVGRWLATSLFRNWRGVIAGIFGAWFNIPFVVLMGTVGAIIGAIVGAVSGTAFGPGVLQRLEILTELVLPLPVEGGVAGLLPTAAWQIGGIIGGIWGAFSGALNLGWIAFYWPWQVLYAADPSWPVLLLVGQTVTALAVGLGYTVWSIASEPWRLYRGGARRPSRREADWIMPIIEECAVRLRLPGIPKVLVSDSREVNAFAESRHIVIHRGLLDHLSYDVDAVSGVIAHELTHWRHGDPVARAFAKGVALPLYLLYELATRVIAGARIRPIQWMLRMLLWGVTVTVRGIVIPVQAAEWRRQEYTADLGAIEAGYSDGLHKALTSFGASFDGARDGWDQTVLRTHPSNELRMERLEVGGGDYDLVPGSGGPHRNAAPGSTSTVQKGWK